MIANAPRVALLAFASLFHSGCDSPRPVIPTDAGSIEFRLVAVPARHQAVIAAGRGITAKEVVVDGAVVGRWVRFEPSLRSVLESERAILRSSANGSELLVVHSLGDVTEQDMEARAVVTKGPQGKQGSVAIALNDAASKRFFQHSVEHVGWSVALILDDRVVAVPKLVSPVRKEMIVSPSTIEKVQVFDADDVRTFK